MTDEKYANIAVDVEHMQKRVRAEHFRFILRMATSNPYHETLRGFSHRAGAAKRMH